MLRQPKHVLIVRGRDAECQSVVVTDRSFGAGIEPFFYFAVPVRKREAAGAIMIAGRVIENIALGWIFQIRHPDAKSAIVDAVRMFIDEYMNQGWGSGGGGVAVLHRKEGYGGQ